MARKKTVLLIAGIIIILLLISRFILSKKQEAASLKQITAVPTEELPPKKESRPVIVKAVQVKREDFEDTLPVMGTIRGYIEVDLKFGINGVIEEFKFKNGEKVKKGELIAALEQKDALVKHQYIQLKLAEHEKLYEIGAIAEIKLKEIRLEEELARLELEKTSLKAPFNGVINNREGEKGRFVTINDRVAAFSSIDEVVAEVGIIEKDMEKIKPGQKGIVKVDAYPNFEFAGLVDNISSSFEGKSRTLAVRIKVPNQKELLLPGMFARVVIYIYEKSQALVIPAMALEKKAGDYSVFVVDKNEMVEERKVKVEYRSAESAVIESGLNEGETVIVEKEGELKAGERVKIMNDK